MIGTAKASRSRNQIAKLISTLAPLFIAFGCDGAATGFSDSRKDSRAMADASMAKDEKGSQNKVLEVIVSEGYTGTSSSDDSSDASPSGADASSSYDSSQSPSQASSMATSVSPSDGKKDDAQSSGSDATGSGQDSSTVTSSSTTTSQDDSSAQEGGTGGNDDPACPSQDEVKACAGFFHIEANLVKVSGNHSNEPITVGSSGVFAVRVTGNQSVVKLTVNRDGEMGSLNGLCLFAAGNKSVIQVNVNADIDTVYHVARGNQTKTAIVVNKGAAINRIESDVKGHSSALDVSGEGAYPTK